MKKLSAGYNQKKHKGILVISKPIAPPWNDSGKNLVKDLLINTTKNKFYVFSQSGYTFDKNNIIVEQITPAQESFSPSLIQKIKIFIRLLRPDPDIDIYHFFFTPNKLTSFFARLAVRFKNKKIIQNISSTPKSYKNIKGLIFADRVIVLSEHSREQLLKRGVENITKINPGIELDDKSPSEEGFLRMKSILGLQNEPVVLFPGDYEFSQAHFSILKCMPGVLRQVPELKFVFACRVKTNKAKAVETFVKYEVRKIGLSDSVIFLNEVKDMPGLLKICSLVIFPVKSLYAKMDIPLVLIESLFEQKPIIISDIPPLNEIMKADVGIKVPVGDPEALGGAIIKLVMDGPLRQKMGAAGRIMVENYFNMKKLAKFYEEIYEHL